MYVLIVVVCVNCNFYGNGPFYDWVSPIRTTYTLWVIQPILSKHGSHVRSVWRYKWIQQIWGSGSGCAVSFTTFNSV